MTEQEWLVSNDPQAMLRHLTHESVAVVGGFGEVKQRQRSFISNRKLRLFATACYLEGVFSEISLQIKATHGFGYGVSDLQWAQIMAKPSDNTIPQADKAHILREIVGNPFKPQEPWWQGKATKWDSALWVAKWGFSFDANSLARCFYETQDFSGMRILGDALEEAGCDNEEVLRHCRGEERCPKCFGTLHYFNPVASQSCQQCPDCWNKNDWPTGWILKRSPCVRGCWVLDLILGKSEIDRSN